MNPTKNMRVSNTLQYILLMLIKASLLTVQFILIQYNEYIDLSTIQMKINDHYPLQVGRAQ